MRPSGERPARPAAPAAARPAASTPPAPSAPPPTDAPPIPQADAPPIPQADAPPIPQADTPAAPERALRPRTSGASVAAPTAADSLGQTGGGAVLDPPPADPSPIAAPSAGPTSTGPHLPPPAEPSSTAFGALDPPLPAAGRAEPPAPEGFLVVPRIDPPDDDRPPPADRDEPPVPDHGGLDVVDHGDLGHGHVDQDHRDDDHLDHDLLVDDHLVDDHDEYEELRPEGRVPRWVGVLVVFALLVGGVVGGAWWWYRRQVDPPGGPGAAVSVVVPQGSSTSAIGSILEDADVIANATVFGFYADRKHAGPFEAGTYQLRKNSDLDLVLATMAEGPTTPLAASSTKVSVPEGLTVKALVARIAEEDPRLTTADLEAALADGSVTSTLRPDGQTSWEGVLFPATYDVGDQMSAADLLDEMSDEMASRVAGLDPDAAVADIKARFGVDVTTYDLLIVASLVQAEAGNADEAAKIATVIYNRLGKGWALGIDATSKYLAELDGSAIDFDSTSPYNTRRQQGLPPTPIAAPGDYALDAAFRPAAGPWMYYVLTDPGSHTFVVTDAEFAAAKQVCIDKGLGCG